MAFWHEPPAVGSLLRDVLDFGSKPPGDGLTRTLVGGFNALPAGTGSGNVRSETGNCGQLINLNSAQRGKRLDPIQSVRTPNFSHNLAFLGQCTAAIKRYKLSHGRHTHILHPLSMYSANPRHRRQSRPARIYSRCVPTLPGGRRPKIVNVLYRVFLYLRLFSPILRQ